MVPQNTVMAVINGALQKQDIPLKRIDRQRLTKDTVRGPTATIKELVNMSYCSGDGAEWLDEGPFSKKITFRLN